MKLYPHIKYDFDFKGDKSDKFVPFILAFLIYSATIAVMSYVFTCNITSEWSNALNGHMTVEFQSKIDGVDATLTEKQVSEIMNTIKSTAGIKSVKKLSESDILKILEPWLRGTSIPDDFPFPTIFDVESEKSVKVDLLALTEKLSKISQGVKIHDHSNWYTPILKISNGLFFFAILLSVLILVTVCATVIFITRKTLGIHKNVVRILQLIGANNSYIAYQFKRYYFFVALKASGIAIIFSMFTIFGVMLIFSGNFDTNTLKYTVTSVAIPVVVIILVMITSKNSVVFFLNNDKWID